MKPRSLRHRLEKAAKALVLIHKWTPNVNCLLDQDKGEHGHLILKFDDGDSSKMAALGKDLENKGYRFRVKNSPMARSGHLPGQGRRQTCDRHDPADHERPPRHQRGLHRAALFF